MKSIRNILTLLVCLLGSVLVYSQPNLLQKYNVGTGNGYGAMQFLYPFEGGVIQRNSSGNAKVSFCIQVNYGLQNTSNYTYKLILDRLDPISGNSTGVITVIPGNLTVSNMAGEIGTIQKDLTIAGGWYSASVQVTDLINSISWTGVHIKFGVGDTFLIAGQSNARGFPSVWDTGLISYDNTPGLVLPDAVRVLTGFKPKVTEEVNLSNDPDFLYKRKQFVLQNGFPLFHTLEKLTLTKDMGIGGIDWFERPIFPYGMASWCWAPLGSKLVSNSSNVPVQFFNFAIDNSSIGHWQKNPINPDPPGGLGSTLESHYKTLSDFIGFQGSVMGFRSVLWHQGERDVTDATSSANYKTRLESLINSIQNDFDPWQNTPTPGRIWEPLNWLVSKVSYSTDGGNPPSIITNDPTNIKGAQVSANPETNGSNKFLGIDSDVFGVGSRGSGKKYISQEVLIIK